MVILCDFHTFRNTREEWSVYQSWVMTDMGKWKFLHLLNKTLVVDGMPTTFLNPNHLVEW